MKSTYIFLFLLLFAYANADAQLQVLSPDGGERFTSGDIVPIIWSGVPKTLPVDIQFSSDDGTTWHDVASGVTGGRYLWSISDIEASVNCLIRVSTQVPDELKPKFIRSFQGHKSGANSVDISPVGNRLVTAGADGVLILWNMETGEEVWRKTGHSSPIIVTRFSPDGSQIATGSIDGKAILWNTVDGSQIHIYNGTGGLIWPVGFSPDGSTLATGNDDGTVSLWSVATGQLLKTFTVHNEAVRYLEYTQDGTKIVASSTDRGATITNANTYQQLLKVIHTTASLGGAKVVTNGAQLTHDGTVLVTCGYDGWVRFWNAQNGKLITEKSYHGGKEVSEVRISPNGKWMTSTGYDGTTKIVEPHTGEILADIDPQMNGMIRASFSADSRFLAISHFDGKATLWELPFSEFDLSNDNWTTDVCEFELSDIKQQENSSFSTSELDLKVRP